MALCDEIETGRLTAKPALPTFYLHAGIASLFQALANTLKTRAENKERRDAFKNLLKLDARTLKDIGVTRQDVVWASKLPISRDAASELKMLRDGNRQQGGSK